MWTAVTQITNNNLEKNSKSILTSQQTFISNKQNVFTEEVNKIAWSANSNKRIQSADSFKHIHTEQAKIQYTKKKRLNVTI